MGDSRLRRKYMKSLNKIISDTKESVKLLNLPRDMQNIIHKNLIKKSSKKFVNEDNELVSETTIHLGSRRFIIRQFSDFFEDEFGQINEMIRGSHYYDVTKHFKYMYFSEDGEESEKIIYWKGPGKGTFIHEKEYFDGRLYQETVEYKHIFIEIKYNRYGSIFSFRRTVDGIEVEDEDEEEEEESEDILEQILGNSFSYFRDYRKNIKIFRKVSGNMNVNNNRKLVDVYDSRFKYERPEIDFVQFTSFPGLDNRGLQVLNQVFSRNYRIT